MLPEKQDKLFTEFTKSIGHNKCFDQKTTLLIQMAAAMAFGCEF
ncbi:MAG: hypothetical protein ACMUJM_16655 [bacterium]